MWFTSVWLRPPDVQRFSRKAPTRSPGAGALTHRLRNLDAAPQEPSASTLPGGSNLRWSMSKLTLAATF
jgi:hypothetical protein